MSLVSTETIEPAKSVTAEPWYSRFFSFRSALTALFIVLAVMTVRARFNDPDLWWHLKLGQIVATTRHIPEFDTLSYTTGHHHVVPHEWLSQLLIYASYAAGGYSGLMFWECAFVSGILIAGFYLCQIYGGDVRTAFLGTLSLWAFGTVGYAIRPQLVGYLLLTFELILLHLGRTRNPRWLLLLPPLFAVWVNCHGSFWLGLGVLAVVAFTDATDLHIRGFAPAMGRSWSGRWLPWIFALSAAALFLNPNGLEQILYPFSIMLHSPINLGNVQEWRHLTVNDQRTWFFIAEVACFAALIFLRRAWLTLDESIVLAYTAFEAVRHERLLFPFGILAAPVLCRLLTAQQSNRQEDRQRPGLNAAVIGVALLVVWRVFPSGSSLRKQAEDASPVEATRFIQQHHLPGPILNNYDFGGYLIWAAPEYPVFVDGRADIFEWTGVLGTYGNWVMGRTPARGVLDAYHVNLCLLSPDAGVVPQIRKLPEWKQVYADAHALVFERVPVPAVR